MNIAKIELTIRAVFVKINVYRGSLARRTVRKHHGCLSGVFGKIHIFCGDVWFGMAKSQEKD